MMLQLKNVSAGYDGAVVLRNINVVFNKGRFYGILGPNGSGKTTLLKSISNVVKLTDGIIELEGKPIVSFSSKELAKKISVLPQLNASSFSNTVRETVAIGRYPHQKGFFSTWSKEDESAVNQAMEQTDVKKFEHTPLPYLSGGEQQRAFIAQALAQHAELLLLDEPTNHLDITHQKQSLDIIRKKVNDEGLTVIAVFHDINLASIYCDEILLMDEGEIRKTGKPSEVIVEKEIEQVYQASVATYAHPKLPKPQISMKPYVEQTTFEIMKDYFSIREDGVFVQSPQPLKTISSSVYNAGIGWYTTFINRYVAPDYQIASVQQEVEAYLNQNQIEPTTSAVMLTAVHPKNAIIERYADGEMTIHVAITAGVGEAIDVSKAYLRGHHPHIGTINTFVFVNGTLTDEAFVQALITATEAKVKALQDEGVQDKVSGTIASGTGTDSLLIAATQQGEHLNYAGPLTKIGQLIGRGVYDATRKAILQYNSTLGGNDENLYEDGR